MFEFTHSLWPSLLYTLGCEKKLRKSLFKFIYNLIGKYLQTKNMFEFEKEAGDLSDYTIVLPAVSVGNVGESSAFLVYFFSSASNPKPRLQRKKILQVTKISCTIQCLFPDLHLGLFKRQEKPPAL